jgi:hypothetical protein
MSSGSTHLRGRSPASSWLALLAAGLLGAAAAPARADVRVLESDAAHVRVEVAPPAPELERLSSPTGDYVRLRMTGAGMTEEVGRPEVPTGSIQVAVPSGYVPRLRVVRQQWSSPRDGSVTPVPVRVGVRDPFGADRVEERPPLETPAYRAIRQYPAEPFRLSDLRDLRGLRTVGVIWHGVLADVAAGTYRVLESAVLEVTFEPEPQRAAAPALAPAAPDRLWDRTRRWPVANPNVARAWARRGPGDGAAVGDTPWGGGTQVKVRIAQTGLVKMAGADLLAAGFPSGVAIGDVAVYQRTFSMGSVDDPAVAAESLFVPVDVPVIVRDAGTPGVLDAGDAVLFYGRSFRDQWMTSGWEHEDQFQTDNFYWVRARTGAARMAGRAAQIAQAGADSLDSTPSVYFREDDDRYHDRPIDFGPGAVSFESEFVYRNNGATPTSGEVGWTFSDPFTVPDPVVGRPAELVARVCGQGAPVLSGYTNIVTFTVNGAQVGEDTFYNANIYPSGSLGTPGDPSRVLWSHPISAGLSAGTNTFAFRGRSYTGGGTTSVEQVTRFLFDWYRITYSRHLRAASDRLLLSTEYGTTADQRIRVSGFGGTDLLLLDVTDPADPVNVTVAGGQVVAGTGGTWDLRFGHDNTVAPGRYLAIRESSVPAVPAGDLTGVTPSGLLTGGLGARWVAVAEDGLVGRVQPLAAHRAQRYSTQVTPLSDVWDVFGNGARHPDALKAYAAYAYHRWADPVVFLLLVGDASEDHRGVESQSDPDLLPSHSLWAQYEGAPEETDQYYGEVTRATPGTGAWDDLADIYVGRLSVGTPEELDWNVERIVRYETEDVDGVWRRRVLLLGDDAFSGSLGGGATSYRFNTGELGFCSRSRLYADSLAQHPFESLIPEILCMGDYSNPCSTSCYWCGGASHTCGSSACDPDTLTCTESRAGVDCGFWFQCRTEATCTSTEWNTEYTCMRERMIAAVLPQLRGRLNDGVLLWNFQGHANRFFLTHEWVWRDDTLGSRRDVDNLTNYGRPFLFLGFACHLAEFDKADEKSREDCMSEKLMNKRQLDANIPAGCVGAFASSGFEFLSPNLDFNQFVLDAFFYPEKAADGTNLAGGGTSLPPATDGGVYRWTLGESITRARLMFQNAYSAAGQTRQSAQRFVLLGDPALEANTGSPRLSVTVNGLPVEDPEDGFFLDPSARSETVSVEVTASDGRGVQTMRLVDSAQGELPASAFQVADNDSSADGVKYSRTLRYDFQPRAEEYSLTFEAVDGSGATARFVLSVTNRFGFTGGEPAVYPSPFQDRTWLFYRLTNAARSVDVSVYTVTGRKIRDIHEGERVANQQLRVGWDGRDEHGNEVANGTYLFRVVVAGDDGDLTRIIPVVKMR